MPTVRRSSRRASSPRLAVMEMVLMITRILAILLPRFGRESRLSSTDIQCPLRKRDQRRKVHAMWYDKVGWFISYPFFNGFCISWFLPGLLLLLYLIVLGYGG